MLSPTPSADACTSSTFSISARSLLRFVHPLGVREAHDQLTDPGVVGLCLARVNADRIRGRGGQELAFQIVPMRIQCDVLLIVSGNGTELTNLAILRWAKGNRRSG